MKEDAEYGRAYLGSTSCVLCCSTRNEFGVVVLKQILVETHVLFFGENSVVGFDPVLFQEGSISKSYLSKALEYSFGLVGKLTPDLGYLMW